MSIAADRARLAPPVSLEKGRLTGLDRKYLLFALAYAALGMSLGMFMAASNDHRQFVTHAHVLLVGFVASLLYAIIHKLWLGNTASRLARVQFLAHQGGAAVMVIGLFALYGALAPIRVLEPLLAAASIATLAGALLMLLLVLRSSSQQAHAGRS